MVTNLEWSDNLEGTIQPCICSFGSGFLIYGPDNNLRVCSFCLAKSFVLSFTYLIRKNLTSVIHLQITNVFLANLIPNSFYLTTTI